MSKSKNRADAFNSFVALAFGPGLILSAIVFTITFLAVVALGAHVLVAAPAAVVAVVLVIAAASFAAMHADGLIGRRRSGA